MLIFAKNLITMKTIKDFSQLSEVLISSKRTIRVVAVEANDSHCHEAIERATKEGWAEVSNIHLDTPEDSARRAVEMVRSGDADVIMKGIVTSDVLLRAIINKETGILPQGNVLSHVSVMHIPGMDRLLFMSDAAVIPYPTLTQRIAMINYAIMLCGKYGIDHPRVALIHCNEKVSEKFPVTLDYKELKTMDFGNAVVDGPLDVMCAINEEALKTKHIVSPLEGKADVLIMPDIEAGNVFYKTLTAFTNTHLAVGLFGAQCPVSLTSRGDTSETKYNSLAMACLQVIKKEIK